MSSPMKRASTSTSAASGKLTAPRKRKFFRCAMSRVVAPAPATAMPAGRYDESCAPFRPNSGEPNTAGCFNTSLISFSPQKLLHRLHLKRFSADVGDQLPEAVAESQVVAVRVPAEDYVE